MAEGGNNQRSNGSRFTKSYSASNSFVTKVASRVSDYLGGWFGTPLKTSHDAESRETTRAKASGDTTEKRSFENVDARRPTTFLTHRVFDDVDTLSSPAKRFKISDNEKVDIDFPISPIPSTSGLFQSAVNHTFDVSKGDRFEGSGPGPSSLRGDKFRHANDAVPQASSTTTDVKANGATDNHSDSSESTSGCSSLVPQSDRLSQSAYVGSGRKRNLEEKLKYARQLQQSRASLYLNRSIPVSDAPGARKKPSFDVTVYGSPSVDKSFLREKLINSPFYTGQTSYGGASAYRLSRSGFFSQRNARMPSERREGVQVQVKPSHQGSTEDLSNMSHTAKKILEALEQFSTPVNDAKRIPVGRSNVPLGMKRRRFDDMSDARLTLSTPISPLNRNAGPVITGLNVPTVPDLLKLKRLERIQNSTAAARQVAIRERERQREQEQEQEEYRLPNEKLPAKRTGKIVTKLKNKEKDVPLEKLEEVNLPKIPLPITTLPKFDFELPAVARPAAEEKASKLEKPGSKNFVFSPPIALSVQNVPESHAQKKNFTFSKPLNANGEVSEPEKKMASPLVNFMSSDAIAKLKRKSISDGPVKSAVPPVPAELKTGSVMDFLTKNADAKETAPKPASDTWECTDCLIRNINDSKICQGCRGNRVTKTAPPPPENNPPPALDFGDKFKPPSGSWSCKECFVNNDSSATKCIACESPKQSPTPSKPPPNQDLPNPPNNGFGDMFKKRPNQWECSVCMVRNKEADTKCAACETPKPGATSEKTDPKFTFGAHLGDGFKFGIDKPAPEATGVKSAADSSTFKLTANGSQPEPSKRPSQFNAISTSVGVFTFGIPAPPKDKEHPKTEAPNPPTETSGGSFLVTSTSGSSLQREDSQSENKSNSLKPPDTKDLKPSDSSKSDLFKFTFGAVDNSSLKPPQDKPNGTPHPKNPPAPIFGASSTSTALETVSSSTTDFSFAHNKPFPGPSKPPDSVSTDPPATLPFTPFATAPSPSPAPAPAPASTLTPAPTPTPTPTLTPTPILNHNPNSRAEDTKCDSAVSTSGTVTTKPYPFSPSPVFNIPKITFGSTTSTTAPDFTFGAATSSAPNPSPFAQAAPSFTTSTFKVQPSATPSGTTFGTVAQSSEKTTINASTPFGANLPNSFGTTPTPSQNQEPPKPFPSFGANSSLPNFANPTPAPTPTPTPTPSPAPSFGAAFIQPTNPSDKPPAPAPFIFGATTTTSTAAPSLSGVFTFGATKPESKPAFTFGQSAAPNFSFGSTAPTTNFFGAFAQSKPESSLGAANSVFGSATPSIFGQTSAPAAFESTAPKFDFGDSLAQSRSHQQQQQQHQQQQETKSLFQFGAAPTHPASAPAGPAFNLSVPQKFNFTGGQTTTFSATSDAESPSVMRGNRKMIKAVRRTNRDSTRRPQ